jgi:ferredoxin
VCQSCAKKQLLRQPDTYESCISCPSCGLNCKPEDKEGVREAANAEFDIILEALRITEADHSPSEKDIKFVKLRTCLNALQKQLDPNFVPDRGSEPTKKDNKLQIAVTKLRREITEKMKDHWPNEVTHIPHPLDLITFVPNAHLEGVLLRNARMQPLIMVDGACHVCNGEITTGRSVLLTCACIVCRACALNAVMDYDGTFHTGELPCPNARCSACISNASSLFTLRNVPSLKRWETELVESAATYFGPFLPTIKRMSKHTLASLLRWYEAFGHIDHTSTTALTCSSEERMRLRIAILEERRLNETGLLRTMGTFISDAEARWGFLRGADIPHNSILERLVLQLSASGDAACSPPSGSGSSSNSSSTSTSSTFDSSSSNSCTAGCSVGGVAVHTSVAERIEQGLRGLIDAKKSARGLSACNALKKLIWVATFIHRLPGLPVVPYFFEYEEEVCTAVEVVLRGMSRALGPAECKKALQRVREAVTEAKVLLSLAGDGLLKLPPSYGGLIKLDQVGVQMLQVPKPCFI